MTRAAALPVAFFLLLSAPQVSAAAQRKPASAPAAATADGTAAAVQPPILSQTARETRQQLQDVLEQYGPALPRILKLDPSLLTNDAYLQPYPVLRQFLAQHPEIPRNASYYFSEYGTGMPNESTWNTPQERSYRMWDEVLQGFLITFFFTTILGGVVWLIRTVIDHRRWMRVSKIQTDVHNKLLDRLTSNEELLAYIQTPAGKRFLESAPLAIENPRAVNAPLGRILWSAQIGAVLAIAGVGIEIVAANAIDDVAQPLVAVGIFVIAIGIGFAVSAGIAYVISRRLGLLPAHEPAAEIRG